MRRFEDVCTQKENEIHFQYEPDKNDIFFHAEVYLPIFQFQWGIEELFIERTMSV